MRGSCPSSTCPSVCVCAFSQHAKNVREQFILVLDLCPLEQLSVLWIIIFFPSVPSRSDQKHLLGKKREDVP